jgi:membrane protease YdiL (CAAX protease family)
MWAKGFTKRTAPEDERSYKTVRSRRRDFIELAGVYGLILVVIWTPRPWQMPLLCVAAVSIIAVVAVSYEGLRPMGLCTANLTRSIWAIVLAMAIACVAIWFAGRMHTLRLPPTLGSWLYLYGGYVIWAGLQQLFLQSFFLSRSLRLLGDATAASALSAGLFAVAHLPNPILTLITLICGLASCLFFLHYKNLWPLAVAHAILGISIAITIPVSLDHNMRVGINYVNWADRAVMEHAAVGTAKINTAKP